MRIPAILSALALAILPCAANAGTVRIQASDILANPLSGYFASYAASKVECTFEGSVNALSAMRDGHADLAIIAVPDGQKLPEDFECTPFVFDAAIVVVNENNPLREINLRQLAQILARSGSLDKWGGLGLRDPWETRAITVYLPDSSTGVTLQLLRCMTIMSGPMKDGIGTLASPEQTAQIVRDQTSSMVVIRGLVAPLGGRALAVSLKDGADQYAYLPTQDSIFYGDYALRLPFFIAVKKDAPKEVRDVVDALLTDATADVLGAAGFIPVPKSERHSPGAK